MENEAIAQRRARMIARSKARVYSDDYAEVKARCMARNPITIRIAKFGGNSVILRGHTLDNAECVIYGLRDSELQESLTATLHETLRDTNTIRIVSGNREYDGKRQSAYHVYATCPNDGQLTIVAGARLSSVNVIAFECPEEEALTLAFETIAAIVVGCGTPVIVFHYEH